MTKYLTGLALLCLLGNCDLPAPPTASTNQVAPPEVAPPLPESTCKSVVKPLAERNGQYWFNVENFDAANPDCYKMLRQYAKEAAASKSGTFSFHFFDNLPDFKPPADGRSNYGGEKVMNQEILLYQNLQGNEFYLFDNWDTGKYKEVSG